MCPVCGEMLIESEKSFSCQNRHLFDKARKGYVNLLLGRDASLHGDSKDMALARYEVMQAGIYAPLQACVIQTLKKHVLHPAVIADCGCGECYYTEAVQNTFPDAQILATDISKAVLEVANRRDKRIHRAVASTYRLPIASACCDAALNIFSPFAAEEYARILKPGGRLLTVIPLEKHLWELKQAVYEKPYFNEPKNTALVGYSLIEENECTYTKTLTQAHCAAVFDMTPYHIKTAPQDRQKLDSICEMNITFSCKVLLYRKEHGYGL